ncbi:MAG: dihydropteroate synthase, partial [Tepidisphaeraceae bacterium]
GADLLDVGGESTRPGAAPVAPAEQRARIRPVLRECGAKLPIIFSIDTSSSAVARAALDAGAWIINDISAARDDPEILRLAADRSAPIVLMHMQNRPADMQVDPCYTAVVAEVRKFLQDRAQAAIDAGVSAHRILLDPGMGFGKTVEHNLELLRNIQCLTELPQPIVVGASRKRFIGAVTNEPDPVRRIFGTAATVAWCIANKVSIVRVHDVGPMVQVVRMIRAIKSPAATADGRPSA